MRGRKTKLTPELLQRVVDIVRAGNYLETAAKACGIHRSTLHRWLERGEKQTHGMYRKFYLAVEKAQGEAELRVMLLIAKAAATGEWRAAAWMLERRAPKRYGTQVQATLREEMNSMLAHLETVLDRETFEKVMKSIEEQDTSGVGNRPPVKDSSTAVEARQKLLERVNQLADKRAANDDGSSQSLCTSSASAKGKGDGGGGAK